jgi:hypothetical protein
VVKVQLIGAADEAPATVLLGARYGDAVAVDWLGSQPHREVPHPFGSWMSEGRQIRVFFGLDHTVSSAAMREWRRRPTSEWSSRSAASSPLVPRR